MEQAIQRAGRFGVGEAVGSIEGKRFFPFPFRFAQDDI